MGVNRQARREQHPTGSCLVLWRKRDLKDAERVLRRVATGERRPPAPAPKPVRVVVDRDYADEVVAIAAERRHAEILGNPRRESTDKLIKAWVQLVQDKLAGTSLVFFTGTYSDEYGMSHGLMLPRNVQADFRRALKEAGLEQAKYINAVEPHQLRSVLHCHALVEASESDAVLLKAAWDKRGWSSAPGCTDGGVAYCCKYALKKSTADSFEWRW